MLPDVLVIAVLYFAALAWGSNEPWAMMIIAAGSFTTLAARLATNIRSESSGLLRSPVLLPALLFLGFAAVQRMNPRVALGAPVAIPHTVEPYSTGLYLLLYGGLFALMLAAVLGFRTRRSVTLLLLSIIALGVFEALYGLVQYLGEHAYVWNYPVESQGNVARGTFINRNHYALLLNMALAAGVGHLYHRSIRLLRGQDLTLRHIISAPGSAQLAWSILWLALIGLAVVFSMSRLGIIAMFGSVGLMIGVGRMATHAGRTRALALVLLVAIVSLALYTGVDAVLARYERVAEAGYMEKDRLPIWREAVKLIAEQPYWGHGLGTFEWTFPAYERYEPDLPARYAHCDYLQVMAETGLVGLAFLVWAFAAAWRTAVRNLRHSTDSLARGIGLATLGVLTATALQEATDFSLYIPGVATLFTVLIGLNERVSRPSEPTPE